VLIRFVGASKYDNQGCAWSRDKRSCRHSSDIFLGMAEQPWAMALTASSGFYDASAGLENSPAHRENGRVACGIYGERCGGP